MRVLITGASGFLGGRLAAHLTQYGMEVVATGRDRARLDTLASAALIRVSHDLSSGPLHIGPLDAVVHAAGLSAPFGLMADFEAANVRGTESAIETARMAGATRFVQISSPTVYFAMRDQLDVSEDFPLPTPINAYAATKARGETLALAAQDIGPVVLRPRGIYGAGDTALLPRMRKAAQNGALPLLRGGVAEIDLTHISDVCRAIRYALITRGVTGEVFNISGGEVLPVQEIVARACAPLGITPRWRALPMGLALPAAKALDAIALRLPHRPEPKVTPYTLGLFAYRQSLDISKAEKRLGWRPKLSFDEGLAETFAGKK